MCVYIRIFIRVQLRIRMCICIYAYAYACAYAYLQVYVFAAHTNLHMYIYACVCERSCRHIYIFTHTYIHVHARVHPHLVFAPSKKGMPLSLSLRSAKIPLKHHIHRTAHNGNEELAIDFAWMLRGDAFCIRAAPALAKPPRLLRFALQVISRICHFMQKYDACPSVYVLHQKAVPVRDAERLLAIGSVNPLEKSSVPWNVWMAVLPAPFVHLTFRMQAVHHVVHRRLRQLGCCRRLLRPCIGELPDVASVIVHRNVETHDAA